MAVRWHLDRPPEAAEPKDSRKPAERRHGEANDAVTMASSVERPFAPGLPDSGIDWPTGLSSYAANCRGATVEAWWN